MFYERTAKLVELGNVTHSERNEITRQKQQTCPKGGNCALFNFCNKAIDMFICYTINRSVTEAQVDNTHKISELAHITYHNITVAISRKRNTDFAQNIVLG